MKYVAFVCALVPCTGMAMDAASQSITDEMRDSSYYETNPPPQLDQALQEALECNSEPIPTRGPKSIFSRGDGKSNAELMGQAKAIREDISELTHAVLHLQTTINQCLANNQALSISAQRTKSMLNTESKKQRVFRGIITERITALNTTQQLQSITEQLTQLDDKISRQEETQQETVTILKTLEAMADEEIEPLDQAVCACTQGVDTCTGEIQSCRQDVRNGTRDVVSLIKEQEKKFSAINGALAESRLRSFIMHVGVNSFILFATLYLWASHA